MPALRNQPNIIPLLLPHHLQYHTCASDAPFVVRVALCWRGGESVHEFTDTVFVHPMPSPEDTISVVDFKPEDKVVALKKKLFVAMKKAHAAAVAAGGDGAGGGSGGRRGLALMAKEFAQDMKHSDNKSERSFQGWVCLLFESLGAAVASAASGSGSASEQSTILLAKARNTDPLHALKHKGDTNDASSLFLLQIPSGTIFSIIPSGGTTGKNKYHRSFVAAKQDPASQHAVDVASASAADQGGSSDISYMGAKPSSSSSRSRGGSSMKSQRGNRKNPPFGSTASATTSSSSSSSLSSNNTGRSLSLPARLDPTSTTSRSTFAAGGALASLAAAGVRASSMYAASRGGGAMASGRAMSNPSNSSADGSGSGSASRGTKRDRPVGPANGVGPGGSGESYYGTWPLLGSSANGGALGGVQDKRPRVSSNGGLSYPPAGPGQLSPHMVGGAAKMAGGAYGLPATNGLVPNGMAAQFAAQYASQFGSQFAGAPPFAAPRGGNIAGMGGMGSIAGMAGMGGGLSGVGGVGGVGGMGGISGVRGGAGLSGQDPYEQIEYLKKEMGSLRQEIAKLMPLKELVLLLMQGARSGWIGWSNPNDGNALGALSALGAAGAVGAAVQGMVGGSIGGGVGGGMVGGGKAMAPGMMVPSLMGGISPRSGHTITHMGGLQ